MAYFIFLKSLRSLGEFRKNHHVKIPPKSPCANFQSIGIFKNQILFRKEFFRHFRPIWPFDPAAANFFFFSTDRFSPPSPLGLGLSTGPAHPHGPTGHPLLAPTPEPSTHSAAGRPRTTPTVDPDASTGRKKWSHQSPIKRCHFPSSIIGNRRLQPGPLKLLQRRPLKALGLPSLSCAL
jgi:hypothetical protein